MQEHFAPTPRTPVVEEKQKSLFVFKSDHPSLLGFAEFPLRVRFPGVLSIAWIGTAPLSLFCVQRLSVLCVVLRPACGMMGPVLPILVAFSSQKNI